MDLKVPSKKQLLAHYYQAQKIGRLIVVGETLVVVCFLYLRSLLSITTNLAEAGIIVGASIFPTILSLAYTFAKKKKLARDLKPTTKYGHITKADILDVCESACNRMGVKANEVSFYITSEKQVNASALTLGLGYVFKSLRVVMLNRSTLHALKKDELLSIVAHELAHIYRYPLFFQEALVLRLFNSAVLGLFLYTILSNVLFVIIIVGAYQGLLARYFGQYSVTIEYLCDDCGAEVAGIEPALRAEFLISKHAEILGEAYYYLLKARREGQTLSAKNLGTLLEDSLSYDCLSSEELNKTIEKNLRKHKEKIDKNFFEYLKGQVFSDSLDAEDDLEDEFLKLQKIRKIELLQLPPHEGELTLTWFKELVSGIRANPKVAVFRTANDLSDDGSTHPGPRKRMLYLWQQFVEQR